MCRRLYLALALFAGGLVGAAHAGLWTDNYAQATERARTERKFLFLNFTGSDWCGWCIKLDKEVFSQSAFKKFAGENLVCVTVDFPRRSNLPGKTARQNEELKKQHGITGYPTLILLLPDGTKIARTSYQPGGAEAYVAHLEKLLEPHRAALAAAPTNTAPAAAPGSAEVRTWTSADGQTVEARLEQRVGNTVHLRTSDGRRMTIQAGALSAEDQAYLRNPRGP